MNEVSIHVSYIFGNKQNSKKNQIHWGRHNRRQRSLDPREANAVGPNRPERQK